MNILGLNAYHGDSAACVIVDGKLVAAAEEERFRRVKHWAGLPTKAIDYCLQEARLRLEDVEHIAINRKPGVNNLRRAAFVLRRLPHPKLVLQKIQNMRKAATTKETLEKTYQVQIKAEMHNVEHHLAHLASAFLVSGFEEAACISIDGFGDFASTALGFGSGKELTIDQRVYFPHSLGIFYSALTQFLGFPHYGDEYKVMGLAPYGDPNLIDPLREVVGIQSDGTFRLNLKYFRHHNDDVSYTWNDCTPSVGLLYRSTLTELLGPARAPNEPLEQKHKDLARSVQVTYEVAFLALLQALHKMHPSDNLALAGGCAMNSVANGKVYRRTPFKKMYLPAAAGDAGGAIGAAAIVQAQLAEDRGQPRKDSGASVGSKSEVRDQHPGSAPVSGVGESVSLSQSLAASPSELSDSAIRNPQSAIPEAPSSDPESPAAPEVPPLVSAATYGVAGSDQMSEISKQSEIESASALPSVLTSDVRPLTSGTPIPGVPLRPLDTAYLGPESTEEEIHALLDWKKKDIAFAECVVSYIAVEEDLTKQTAQAIADGKVIGWFQGRMEWGPRALGNRSILADPRRADMKEILNAKIKRRESFRPFAPSVLREAVSDWFETDDDVPFMMEVFQIRAQKRSFIPAVTHVDGSGRLQTVHKETNPRYYRVIEHFRDMTGIPMVLNTSFNENEPVVCYPEEALDCFLRTKMDLLVLGNFWIARQR